MDAVKFLRERKRMCISCGACKGCLISERSDGNGCINVDYKYQVKVVEEWSKEHPVKTRMSEFMKQFPNVVISSVDNLPNITPCTIDYSVKERLCKNDFSCAECREKYWLEEIE